MPVVSLCLTAAAEPGIASHCCQSDRIVRAGALRKEREHEMTRDSWNLTASQVALSAILAAGIALAPVTIGKTGDRPIATKAAAAQSADGGDDDGVGAEVGADIGGVSADIGADIGSGGVGADIGADIGGGADVGADIGGGSGDDAGGAGGSGGGTESGGDAEDDAAGDEGPGSSAEGPVGSESGGVDDATGDASDRLGILYGDQPGIRPMDRRYSYFTSLDVQTPAFRRYRAAAERNKVAEAGDALSAATVRPITEDLVVHVNEALDVQTALTPGQIVAAANGVPAFHPADSISSAAEELTGNR